MRLAAMFLYLPALAAPRACEIVALAVQPIGGAASSAAHVRKHPRSDSPNL